MKSYFSSSPAKKPAYGSLIAGILLASCASPALSNQLTVNFRAVYTAATCTISVPTSVTFNQGDYAAGIPSTAIQGDNIQQSFNISFSDCQDSSARLGAPHITVSGNIVTLNGSPLFSDNNGAEGQAVGYGVKLSTLGNSLFNSVSNLAENNVISSTQGTSVDSLNNQQLPVKAVLSCGKDDCGDLTPRNGGTFTANVIFRLSYE